MKNIETFDELLLCLAKSSMEITVGFDGNDICYTIQTGAKSNLTIARAIDDLCSYKDRYTEGACSEFYDFLVELKGCLYGRDYASAHFFDFLEEHGMLKKTTEIKVRYE